MLRARTLVTLSMVLGEVSLAQRISPYAFTERRYERKSISYVDFVSIESPSVSLVEAERSYVLEQIKVAARLPRFDYNPIPVPIMRAFLQSTSRSRSIGIEPLAQKMEETVVPTIVAILDYEKELRAAALLGEAQRNTFLATKARTQGITAVELEKVMNAAFVFVPYVGSVGRSRVRNAVECQIAGGVLWYRLRYRPEGSTMTFIGKTEGSGSGNANATSRGYFSTEGTLTPQQFAFRSAAENLARDIAFNLRSMTVFNLVAPIEEVDGETVRFALGIGEGVSVDDYFEAVEYTQAEGDTLTPVVRGVVRVSDVERSDGQRRLSSARLVISDGIGAGMELLERPTLSIESGWKLASFPLSTTAGEIVFPHGSFVIPAQHTRTYCLEYGALANVGRGMGISQLYLTFEGTFGLVPFTYALVTPTHRRDLSTALFYAGAIGIEKKFSVRRTSFVVGYEFGAHMFSDSFEDTITHTDCGFRTTRTGPSYNVSIEYLVSPTTYIGVRCGYKDLKDKDLWSAYEGSDGYEGRGPVVGQHGLSFSFYFGKVILEEISDPWNWIRGFIGF